MTRELAGKAAIVIGDLATAFPELDGTVSVESAEGRGVGAHSSLEPHPGKPAGSQLLATAELEHILFSPDSPGQLSQSIMPSADSWPRRSLRTRRCPCVPAR